MSEEIKYNLAERLVVYAISVIVGIVAVTLTMFLAASICLALDMSDNFSSLVSGICLGVGAVVSGFLTGKKIKCGGIINGIFCGIIMYLIVFFLSLFISENGFTIVTLSHSLITVISSAIGGVLGVNTSSKRKVI